MAERSGIMLAYPFEEKRLDKWEPPFIVQPKLDGERCRAVIDENGNVTLFSSSEEIIKSVPHIRKALFTLNLRNIELDGELYKHGMDFEDVHSIVGRTVNLNPWHREMEFHVFDIVNADPQYKRLRQLSKISFYNLPIKNVPLHTAENLDEVLAIKEKYIEIGYEGIVVRHFLAPYVRKRSIYMMKLKPKKDDIYKIKGYSIEVDKEGIIKETRLGRIICAGDENRNADILGEYPPHIKLPDGYFGIGSGLTASDREMYWKDRESLINLFCHVQYQHITPGKGVPRFPIFIEIIDYERAVERDPSASLL